MKRILWSLSLIALLAGCGGDSEKPKPEASGPPAPPRLAAAAPAPVVPLTTGPLRPDQPHVAAPAPEETVAAPAAPEVGVAMAAEPTAAPAPAPGPTPVPAPAAAAAAEPPPAEPDVVFPEPKVGTVTARRLNVRAGPSVDGKRIGVLKKDGKVAVVGTKGKWLKIEIPERMSLWIVAKFVDLPSDALPATGTVNANRVRLRSSGDYKATILRELGLGAQLEAVEKVGEWLKVKAPAGTYAWVHGDHIDTGAGGVAAVPDNGETGKTGDSGDGGDAGDQPKTGGTPTEVTEVKGPGVETFAQAEDAYRKALAEEPPNLVPVYMLYLRAYKTEGLPKIVKTKCFERMNEILARLPSDQKKLVDERVKQELAKKIADYERAAREAKAKIPHIIPKYTAKGFMDKAPDVAGIPGTHKLSMSGVLLYYLRPAASSVNLDKHLGNHVGVMGRKRFVKGWGVQVIDVTEVREVGQPPTSRAHFEPIE